MTKVLIVDDEPEIRRSLVAIVEEAGHEAYEAVDGIDALAKIKAIEPDLVLLDWLLPELRGDAVLERLRNRAEYANVSDTVVVILSDYAEDLTKQDLQRLGANHVIAKQDTPERMKEQVRVALLALAGPGTQKNG